MSLVVMSCRHEEHEHRETVETMGPPDTTGFMAVLQKHLNAVSNKDLATLATTFAPNGEMYLMLDQTETMTTANEFLTMHEAWFKDTTWTFETEVFHTDVGSDMGIALVNAMYREPDRNGQPYFNRMVVSYALKNIDGQWYVIKDHATSVEKTAAGI